MKRFLLFLTLICLVNFANAQGSQSVVVKGNNIINLGIGFGSTLYTGTGYTGEVPPISVSFEHILKDGVASGKGAWGIGGYIGYSAAKWEYIDPYWNETYGWKYSFLVIGPRGIFHYNLAKKLDTYGGLFLGYDVVTSKETGNWPLGVTNVATSSGLAYSFFIGCRYFFSDKFAGIAELGYGISYLNIGIALKL